MIRIYLKPVRISIGVYVPILDFEGFLCIGLLRTNFQRKRMWFIWRNRGPGEILLRWAVLHPFKAWQLLSAPRWSSEVLKRVIK